MACPKWIMQLVLDLLSVFLVFLPWIVLQTAVQPYSRGFFCNDESIKYPFRENTVTNAALTVSGFIVSFVVFAITEGVHYAVWRKSDTPPQPFSLTSKVSIPRYLLMVYRIFGIFVFGLAVQQTITNIGKYSIGRLRPHFLSVCLPDFATLNCTIGDPKDGIQAYIEADVCTAAHDSKLKDARMSFPSGHSSFATYVAVFLALYLQARMTWKGSKLLRHFFQAVLIYLAVFVCLSRVSDYKHHWSDVLSGAILGVFVAALTGIHVTNQFKSGKRRGELEDLPYQTSGNSANINQGETSGWKCKDSRTYIECAALSEVGHL